MPTLTPPLVTTFSPTFSQLLRYYGIRQVVEDDIAPTPPTINKIFIGFSYRLHTGWSNKINLETKVQHCSLAVRLILGIMYNNNIETKIASKDDSFFYVHLTSISIRISFYFIAIFSMLLTLICTIGLEMLMKLFRQ